MPHTPARARIESLFDRFEEIGPEIEDLDPIGFPGYPSERERARAASREREAVVCGLASVGGRPVVAAIFEFGFLGGSMGEGAGDRIEAAMRAAADLRHPFLSVSATGGARMQEGMAALAQMPRTVAASRMLAERGIPRIGVLAHPTTGGVYASFASLSDFVVAEAGATIGFAGPRVAEALAGERLPKGSHTAEAALRAGLVDDVLAPDELRGWLARLLSILAPSNAAVSGREVPALEPGEEPGPTAGAREEPNAWERYALTRHPDRPSPRRYVEAICSEAMELRGDRAGRDDPAVFTCVARIDDLPAVVAALDRASPSAAGYRKARRAIELAGRLRLPLVTFVDTPGADPSFASEYSGLAGEIARTFEAILTVDTPVISLITGEGGSGGALALACGDLIAVMENAVFAVIAPEGAAEILHRDPARAPEVAEVLRPTARDLLRLGLADAVIPEPRPAHQDAAGTARVLAEWLSPALRRARADPASRAGRYSRRISLT